MSQFAFDNQIIEEGLDRQNLAVLRRRFEAINHKRLDRLCAALSDRQQLFIQALPILFHTNHPMMPGYVSKNTPAGLANFKPNKEDLRTGKHLARSFTFNYDSPEPHIEGLYVMGSVGTIAQSNRSDLDIWLCHSRGLNKDQLNELTLKCKGIEQWAATLRLEAHIFPMETEAFKRGKMSSLDEESSGNAQRLLLLDEFYRTAIYLGGRMPLWWFVPEQEEANYQQYTNTLLDRRFIRREDVLDFGGISTIPDGEFMGAGIWQLYKAIESPYKSVLKLLLLEAYASDYPKITPLCLNYKKLVYSGVLDINKLDGYVLIYQRIAQYLANKNQQKRLELVRRCFYYKVNKALSKPASNKNKSWQREQMEALTKDWKWRKYYIALLDERPQWKAQQVGQERSSLVSELNYGYQFLMGFANSCGSTRAISREELTVLGRKLQAAFERKPGKIEWINPGISKDLTEEAVSIYESFDEKAKSRIWTVLSKSVGKSGTNGQEIKSSTNLVELLLWCHYNSITTPRTYFDLKNTPSLNEFELRKLISAFQQWLPTPDDTLPHSAFEHAATPTKVLILLNVAKSPTPKLNNKGVQRLSNNVDALRYSGFEENLVVSADLISCNSWNEINTRRFDRENALLEALMDYLQLSLPGTHQKPPKLTIECIGATHASTIKHRVQAWFKEIGYCYYSGKYAPSTRYVFEMAGMLYCLQFGGLKPKIRSLQNEEVLLQHLGAEQAKPSAIVLDSCALRRHPLRAIAKKITGRSISVFFRRFDFGMEIYTADEKGSLCHFVLRGRRDFSPLAPLHRFLRNIVNRAALSNKLLSQSFGIYPIEFYELHRKPDQSYDTIVRHITTDVQSSNLFEVKAVAHEDQDGAVVYDFYCDDQEFSAMSFGDQLHLVVAQFVLSRRQSKENYPVYITDLDLSLCSNRLSENGELQTIHYLNVKNALEFQLNQAIGILLRA